jgi:hypothetical protein
VAILKLLLSSACSRFSSKAPRFIPFTTMHIADLMGHATIQMTMKYAHLAPSYKLNAVRKLDTFGAGQVVSLPKPTGTRTDTGENDQFQKSRKSLKASSLGR